MPKKELQVKQTIGGRKEGGKGRDMKFQRSTMGCEEDLKPTSFLLMNDVLQEINISVWEESATRLVSQE